MFTVWVREKLHFYFYGIYSHYYRILWYRLVIYSLLGTRFMRIQHNLPPAPIPVTAAAI